MRDQEFDDVRAYMQRSINGLGDQPLFATDASGLWDTYLSLFPVKQRKHFDCHTCREFINRYGGLVTIDDMGGTHPVMWPSGMGGVYGKVFRGMATKVRRAHVSGLFLSTSAVLGCACCGGWDHWSVILPRTSVRKDAYKDMADYAEAMRAMRCLDLSKLGRATSLLRSGMLHKVDAYLPVVEWLNKWQTANVNQRYLLLANAPSIAGHIRGSAFGMLMADIDRMGDLDVVQRFNKAVDPANYMRPKAAPAEGTIDRADKIIAELHMENSFQRRFATLEDLHALWTTGTRIPSRVGFFNSLRMQPQPTYQGVVQHITWAKFTRVVMPTLKGMELQITVRPMNFAAFTTASDPNAPCLYPDGNHEAWYVYHKGCLPQAFGLKDGWVPVVAVVNTPRPGGAVLVLAGCMDRQYDGGLCIFPEGLRPELREIRSVIEAFSAKGRLSRMPNEAAGVYLQSDQWVHNVTVRTDDGNVYEIDRWD